MQGPEQEEQEQNQSDEPKQQAAASAQNERTMAHQVAQRCDDVMMVTNKHSWRILHTQHRARTTHYGMYVD